jgi:ssDNA-binding Zn-finger/Zn-ribbon topoisomerase 1
MSDQVRKRQHSMHIRDARGRRVSQLDPVMMHMLHRHDVIEPEALRAIAEDIGPGYARASRIAGWTVFILGAGGMTIMLVRAYLFRGGLDIVGKILALVNIICLALFMLGIWTGARKLRFGRVKRIMLAHRRCPHCGYNLANLPVDARDGVTVCPECGCGWNMKEEGLRDQGAEGTAG